MTSSLFLIGPMGAGKTAVGRRLGKELGLQFYDTDLEIQEQTGVDIGFIFEKEGEVGFRQREAVAIERLTQLPSIVLATGGGAVLDPQNRHRLSQRGRVVYLRASITQQLRRTKLIANRPLLDGDSPEKTLAEIALQREPIYEEMADLTINTNGRKVPAVAAEIVSWVKGDR
ncbi:MAG: shikimate kinase [Gammaproteobacteria bacterium]|nr:shikimate kinase [Gammaproteobacteria bacterium]MCZ6880246.1 shikimate kinase [Gammaproteobacteria bacterium]TDJ13403.1 MAG: shikimate kinase [Gammaproteobacteria bacterium]